jgi:hypothetical protein
MDWKNTHAMLRFVNFDNVQIAESLAVKAPVWGLSLVDSPQTPLIIAGELNHQRLVWVAFDPLQSTWPLRVSFPIFVANAVDWLNPASASAGQYLVSPAPLSVMVFRKDGARRTDDPGRENALARARPEARDLVISDTARQGIYRLKAGTNEVAFCVNLMDSNESNITPRRRIAVGKYARVGASTLKRANLELWRWIAAAAMVVLLFEWWFYHRRTA